MPHKYNTSNIIIRVRRLLTARKLPILIHYKSLQTRYLDFPSSLKTLCRTQKAGCLTINGELTHNSISKLEPFALFTRWRTFTFHIY